MNSKAIFHPSVEGAQHGAKSLEEFVIFAKQSGAKGAQPSNFMLQNKDGSLKTAKEIGDIFKKHGIFLDGISAHCPFWVHTTAWTGSPTIRPFIPADVAKKPVAEIEQWAEDYIFRLLDLCAELGIKIVPMFWGVAFGWEVATGYPWGFWASGKKGDEGSYDLIAEGEARFFQKTIKIRNHANELGICLAHEIHPGTAAACAEDFDKLIEICDLDMCLVVNADPSHCWENEHWEDRLLKTADRVYACHVKNHVVRPGMPLRTMEPDWQKRPMQFTDLASGDINLRRYAEVLKEIGYPQRYCKVMGTATAPLIVEAESAHADLDHTSAAGIQYVRENLCFPVASGSFEDGMGA
ncbi:MAG: TIM barrel protein [Janthinobacterium sp.]|jgi:sugar phosphate isomerase/epimerase